MNDQSRPGKDGFDEIVHATDTSVSADGDIGWLHRQAYDRGVDPIDNAVTSVASFIATAQTITDGRRDDPNRFPIYGPDVSAEHFACRIVGEMLDAGWRAPSWPS